MNFEDDFKLPDWNIFLITAWTIIQIQIDKIYFVGLS